MESLLFIARVKMFMDISWTQSATHLALYGFIALYLFLIGWLAGWRTLLTLKGRPANSFSTTGEDVSPLSERLVRAHANCYENFPIWGGLLIMAIATNQTSITNSLALIFFGARVAQTIIHIISTSPIAVSIRFVFFLTQFLIAAYWLFAFGQKWFT